MVVTAKRIATTEMQVTSIRLETDLKERLKNLAGNQGYQSLIREVLWDYVAREERGLSNHLSVADIRSTMPAIAHQPECCAITGAEIEAQAPMLLGLTLSGQFVPLSPDSISGDRASHDQAA